MSINVTRAALGGTAAAAIRIVGHRVLDAVWFTRAADSGSRTVAFIGLQLIIGLATVCLYALMRPRFRGAASTAIAAGLLTWAMASLAWSLTVVMGSVPWTMYVVRVFASLPVALIAALVGASLYRESRAVHARASAVARTTV
jgi:hypothetical protein